MCGFKCYGTLLAVYEGREIYINCNTYYTYKYIDLQIRKYEIS